MNATLDGMLCDRCGEPASHFHEDYGNSCPKCSAYWSAKHAPTPADTDARNLDREGFAYGYFTPDDVLGTFSNEATARR